MGTPDDIGVRTQKVVEHHARLTDDGQNVPAGDVISAVHGDSDDPIVRQFLTRLQTSANLIGAHTDIVRAAVKQNADALKQAAADIAGVDQSGEAELTLVSTIVDQTAKDTFDRDVHAAAGSALNDGGMVEKPQSAPSQGASGTQ